MLDGGRLFFSLIRETRPVEMFAENHILVRIQTAPRRSAEPGNPEWRRAGLGEGEGCSLLAGWNSGRKHTAELKLSDRHFSTAPGKVFKLSLEAEMNERDLLISLKPQQARAWSQNKSSHIIYNFLIGAIWELQQVPQCLADG